jgi:16S rRNA (guanine(966)-N(2))-methyltransferase RsmD
VRITGGDAKGRLIRIPPAGHVRPTTDRVRESLFNILGALQERSFLDLFAGSGIVGLEALSRGACRAVFVEKDLRVADALRKSVGLFGFASQSEVVSASVDKAIDILHRRGTGFDVIFADPPYDEGMVAETMQLLDNGELMAPGGIVVMQHSFREMDGGFLSASLHLADKRRYGDTILSFFIKKDC